MINKKILFVMLENDYAIKDLGISSENFFWVNAGKQIYNNVYTFWTDEAALHPINVPLKEKLIAYASRIKHDSKNTKNLPKDFYFYVAKYETNLDKNLIQYADEIKPDYIFFVFLRYEIGFETLKYLKNKYKTIIFMCDDQWRFEKYSYKFADCSSVIATTDKEAYYKYKKIKGCNPFYTQWAGVENNQKKALTDPSKYKHDVSFIGGKNRYREWFIKKLEKEGIFVECYGAGWDNGRVTYEQMNDIFRTSKINLNISNSKQNDIRYLKNIFNFSSNLLSTKNVEQIKARPFEIALAGGSQLTNYTKDLEDFFNIGEEIKVYSSVDECAKIIKTLLEDNQTTLSLGQKSQLKAFEYHTYTKRLKNIIDYVDEISNKSDKS